MDREFNEFNQNIDINFNLAVIAKENEDWEKVLVYSKKALSLIEQTKKSENKSMAIATFSTLYNIME